MRAGQQTMRSLSKKGAWQLGHSYDLNLCCYRRGQRQKPMFAVHASGGAEQSLWKLLCIGGAAVLCFCALCRMRAADAAGKSDPHAGALLLAGTACRAKAGAMKATKKQGC